MSNDENGQWTVISHHRNTDGAIFTSIFGAALCTVFWISAFFPQHRPMNQPADQWMADVSVPVVIVLSILSAGPFFLMSKFLWPNETTVQISSDAIRVCRQSLKGEKLSVTKQIVHRKDIAKIGLEPRRGWHTNGFVAQVQIHHKDGTVNRLSHFHLVWSDRSGLFEAIGKQWGIAYLDMKSINNDPDARKFATPVKKA